MDQSRPTATLSSETQPTATRVEHDSLGNKEVPAGAYYGVQTQRAIENFAISGMGPHPYLIEATVNVKKAAALANMSTGRLDKTLGNAIVQAADEVLKGGLRDQFRVDVYQAGAGTSHNMNTNEVLANRAEEILGGKKGEYKHVHPNDHVNMAQSTNDVFPTAMRIATLTAIRRFIPVLQHVRHTFAEKAKEFDDVIKSGRTHLQDAVPIRLGQEFAAYGLILEKDIRRIQQASESLMELNIGATAVGTGLNAEPGYMKAVVENLSHLTGFSFRQAEMLVEMTQSMASFVEVSGAIRVLTSDLTKIANDLRLLSSGPKTGLGEIILPAVQPGSSIMPGKVNPVMCEMLNMVCYQVMGNDLTVTMAAQSGQLELNVMMPVIIHNMLHEITILTNSLDAFDRYCVQGIVADRERCEELVYKSAALATALAPYIGYEEAAKVAKETVRTNRDIRDLMREKNLLPQEDLEEILKPVAMTEPGIAGAGKVKTKPLGSV